MCSLILRKIKLRSNYAKVSLGQVELWSLIKPWGEEGGNAVVFTPEKQKWDNNMH